MNGVGWRGFLFRRQMHPWHQGNRHLSSPFLCFGALPNNKKPSTLPLNASLTKGENTIRVPISLSPLIHHCSSQSDLLAQTGVSNNLKIVDRGFESDIGHCKKRTKQRKPCFGTWFGRRRQRLGGRRQQQKEKVLRFSSRQQSTLDKTRDYACIDKRRKEINDGGWSRW